MANYYKRIKGINYDREILDLADQLTSGQGDGRISLNDAKKILNSVKDADSYTAIEKRSIKYVRDHYKFTKESDKWFRTEIRKWAASKKKATPKKTKKTAKTSPKKTATSKTESELEITKTEGQPVAKEKKTSLLKAIIVVLLFLLFIFLIQYFIRSCKKPSVNSETTTVKSEIQLDKAGDEPNHDETITKEKIANLSDTEIESQINKLQIRFKKGISTPSLAAKNQLNLVSDFLKKNATKKITVTGHTCNKGSKATNISVSNSRAKSVVDILIANGVKPEQVSTVAKGESSPIASNNTPEGRVKNRRVEFKIE